MRKRTAGVEEGAARVAVWSSGNFCRATSRKYPDSIKKDSRPPY
jgi:hypothetical protein